MADDIRFEFTGGTRELRRATRSAEKLIKRFDKVQKKSTRRRIKNEKTTSNFAAYYNYKRIQSLIKLERKQTRIRERENRRREREAVRSAKREARARERILRKHAARRQRLMRGVGRFAAFGLGGLGLAGGAGIIYKAREILKFDEALARIAGAMDITRKKQFEVREAINKTSLAYGVQRDVLMMAFEEIVDKSGKIDLAVDNFETIAKILRGTKAEATEVGALFASISNAFKGTNVKLKNSEIAQFVEILAAQGDIAQINIANLAASGEKLFGAFKGAGFRTRQDLINFGALIQTAGETGTPEEAATSAVRVLSALFEKKKLLQEKYKVNVYGKGGELRSLDKIMREIMLATGQKTAEDATKLIEIFGKRSIKTMKILAAEFRNNDQEFSEFSRSLYVGANAADNIQRKFDRVAETPSQGFERMKAAITFLGDKALVDNLNKISEAITKVIDDPAKLRQLEDTFKTIGETLEILWKVGGFMPTWAAQLGEDIAILIHGGKPKHLIKLEKEMAARGGLAPLREAQQKVELQLFNEMVFDMPSGTMTQKAKLETADKTRGTTTELYDTLGVSLSGDF